MKAQTRLLHSTLAALVLSPGLGSAQAWTPPKGEGLFSVTLQTVDADQHLASSEFEGDQTADVGTMQGRAAVVDGDFGITDNLAVMASLAFVGGRFLEGGPDANPESPHHALEGDDGEWHSAFQDARVALRYMVSKNLWVLTPVVAVVVPLSDYRTLGHSAIGRGLNELQLELDFGRLLLLSGRPRAYVQGGFRYSYVEQVEGIRPNRTNALIELGYLAHPRLTLRAFGDWQDSHGGLEVPHEVDHEIFEFHDRLAASRWLRAGFGLSVPVGAGVSFFASVGRILEGENTHNATTYSVGTSWGFNAPGFGRTRIRFPESSD